jgi:hypothetical protein
MEICHGERRRCRADVALRRGADRAAGEDGGGPGRGARAAGRTPIPPGALGEHRVRSGRPAAGSGRRRGRPRPERPHRRQRRRAERRRGIRDGLPGLASGRLVDPRRAALRAGRGRPLPDRGRERPTRRQRRPRAGRGTPSAGPGLEPPRGAALRGGAAGRGVRARAGRTRPAARRARAARSARPAGLRLRRDRALRPRSGDVPRVSRRAPSPTGRPRRGGPREREQPGVARAGRRPLRGGGGTLRLRRRRARGPRPGGAAATERQPDRPRPGPGAARAAGRSGGRPEARDRRIRGSGRSVRGTALGARAPLPRRGPSGRSRGALHASDGDASEVELGRPGPCPRPAVPGRGGHGAQALCRSKREARRVAGAVRGPPRAREPLCGGRVTGHRSRRRGSR